MGDLVLLLVPDRLTDALIDHRLVRIAGIWTLRFYNRQGKPVHKANDIRSAGPRTIGAENFKFFRDHKAIVVNVVPVDDWNRRRVFFSLYEFSNGYPQRERVI